MSKGNLYGKLSEKDQILKDLRDKQNKTNSPRLKKAISEKLDVLEGDKIVMK